jgi:N-sulfoglucosamine sulfohydrolase
LAKTHCLFGGSRCFLLVMIRKLYPLLAALLGMAVFSTFASAQGDNSHVPIIKEGPDQPNILWIYIEDTNAWMSCYGDDVVNTRHIDQLASEGIRFDRAYMNSGVCSPTRSAIITGMYQTSIGAHEHYSSFSKWRGNVMENWAPNHLGVKTVPEIMQAAGYYTFNEGKFHYNFVFDPDTLYDRHGDNGYKGAKDGTEWSGRKPGQPFFGQIQLIGGKFRNPKPVIKNEDVPVPSIYPDHPIIRKNIAYHYNTILELDRGLSEIVAGLKRDGLYDNTVIFFFSDHGSLMPRSKQFLYEEGIRVPFILRGPNVPVGKVRDDLVSGIDISATTLAMANVPVPDNMHGMNMMADGFHRDYILAARDRCDYTIDRIRAINTGRYKYIRNFMTDKPYMQPNYRSESELMKFMHDQYNAGNLNPTQARFFSDVRPAEELYDLKNDPGETNNLAHSYRREHAIQLAKHRDILYNWIIETDDKGRFPEADDALRAVIDRWGDDAVNKEYDRVR